MSADELFALQNNVQLQLARASRNQAQCYPEGSDDRISSLVVALEQLEQPLKQLPPDDPLTLRKAWT